VEFLFERNKFKNLKLEIAPLDLKAIKNDNNGVIK
jgi:hypothetical protein